MDYYLEGLKRPHMTQQLLYLGMAKLLEKLQLARIDRSIASCFDRVAALDLLI